MMKKTIKLASAAFAFLAFTACNSDQNTATETDRIDEVETDMDTNMNMEADTTTVMDSTVNDGAIDKIPEERPIQ
jgi:hypothetical protein